MLRGADVTLLASTGCTLPPVPFVKTVPFTTAADLFEAVKANAMDADALVMAAAVADYRPATVAADKVKKHDGEMNIALERTDDILAWVGAHKPEKLFVCGFSMETRDLIENSTAKLHKKNMDMIVANNLKVPGAGFGVDTNVVTIITAQGVTELPLQSKDAVAGHIADANCGKVRNRQQTGQSPQVSLALRPAPHCVGSLFSRASPAQKPPLTGEVVKRSDDRRALPVRRNNKDTPVRNTYLTGVSLLYKQNLRLDLRCAAAQLGDGAMEDIPCKQHGRDAPGQRIAQNTRRCRG